MRRTEHTSPTGPTGAARRRRVTPLLAGVVAGAVAVALAATGPATAVGGSHPTTAADPTPGVLYATSALATDDVWAAGYRQGDDTTTYPLAEHWDGSAWTVTPTPVPQGRDRGMLQDVVAISPKDAWAVGSSVLLSDGDNRTLAEHWNGKKWKVVATAEPAGVSSSYLQSVTAVSADDVWAVGYDYASTNGGSIIEHWDGTSWSLVKNADPAGAFNASLQAVSAVSAKDVWATGYYFDPSGAGVTLAEHWNGKKWKQVASPNSDGSPDTEFHGLVATSASDVWATGYTTLNGSLYQTLTEHWDGKTWSIVDSPNPSGSTNTYLYGIDSLSSKNAWATGYYFAAGAYNTLAEHWNGKKWKIVPTPNLGGTNETFLYGVSPVAPDDVWLSGYSFANGDVPITEHWDGHSWKIVPAA